MHYKDFDIWNEKKKKVDNKINFENIHVQPRDVWWCSIGINVGVEMDGKNRDFERPVLVIKRFNSFMFWGIPLTSQSKKYPTVFGIKHGKDLSYANLAQLRLFSTKRVLRKVDVISVESSIFLLSKLRELLLK